MKYVSVDVDGQNLNARHFAAKSEEDAVKAMVADQITKDEAWAKKAYAACVKGVREADAPKKPETAKK